MGFIYPRGAGKGVPLCKEIEAIKNRIEIETELRDRYAQAITGIHDEEPRLNAVTNQSVYYCNSKDKRIKYEVSVTPWVPLRGENGKLIF